MGVATVGATDVVIVVQMSRHSSGHRLFTDIQMHESWYSSFAVNSSDCLLKAAY
jgi:hypothetical protein